MRSEMALCRNESVSQLGARAESDELGGRGETDPRRSCCWAALPHRWRAKSAVSTHARRSAESNSEPLTELKSVHLGETVVASSTRPTRAPSPRSLGLRRSSAPTAPKRSRPSLDPCSYELSVLDRCPQAGPSSARPRLAGLLDACALAYGASPPSSTPGGRLSQTYQPRSTRASRAE